VTRSPAAPRHRAPESGDVRIASPAEAARPGRHAAGEWDRALYDPRLDEDPFDWLGFAAAAG
jgi:hypothetical protein